MNSGPREPKKVESYIQLSINLEDADDIFGGNGSDDIPHNGDKFSNSAPSPSLWWWSPAFAVWVPPEDV
jgi:hypothetical protein